MFGLPIETRYPKVINIPKQKIYNHVDPAPALKRAISEQIESVRWTHALHPDKLKIASGQRVQKIQVLEICLRQKSLDAAVLEQIDRQNPFHVLMILSFEGNCQAWMSFKEPALSGRQKFKVVQYYHTDWMPAEELRLTCDGLDMDALYACLLRQLTGGTLPIKPGLSLKEAVERDRQKRSIDQKIKALEAKLRKEKQLNIQMRLNGELKRLRKELDSLS